MSTRSPHAHDTLPHPGEPREHDLRVQLEGAWEVLEQVQARQAALLEPLASPRWRRRLRKQPELLWQVRELEVPFAEALARAEHRLQQESLPHHHPLPRLLRQLRAQHARVETLVHDRLARLGEHGHRDLMEGLERLETEMREPPRSPLEDEQVLLSGGPGWFWPQWVPSLLVPLFWMYTLLRDGLWAPALALFTICSGVMLFSMLSRGRFWLTPRRLVWRSFLKGTKQIPLDSISPFGITRSSLLRQWTAPVRVEGKQTLTLKGLQHLDLLEALLLLAPRAAIPRAGLRAPHVPAGHVPSDPSPGQTRPPVLGGARHDCDALRPCRLPAGPGLRRHAARPHRHVPLWTPV